MQTNKTVNQKFLLNISFWNEIDQVVLVTQGSNWSRSTLVDYSLWVLLSVATAVVLLTFDGPNPPRVMAPNNGKVIKQRDADPFMVDWAVSWRY